MNGGVILASIGLVSLIFVIGLILWAINASLKSFKEPKGIF